MATKNVSFEDRITGKAIVLDTQKRIAMVGNKMNPYKLLPGGGIDADESLEKGIIRECEEEIGCQVKLIKKIGTIEDYRNRDGKHCINHCYLAELVGEKGKSRLTDEEKKNGMCVFWFSFEEAIKILEKEVQMLKNGEVTFYNTGFNILRDYKFVLEAMKLYA